MRAPKATYGEQAVAVEVSSERTRKGKPYTRVKILPGYICSTDGTSHMGADNVKRTVLRTYEPHNPLANDADDAHEMGFDVNDPHLLTRAEAESLRNTPHCISWFRGAYPPGIAVVISKMLRRTNFERPEYLAREMEYYTTLARK